MPEKKIVEVFERELDRLKGPHLVEWVHEVKLEEPAFIKLIEGYMVYEYSNWTGRIALEIRIMTEEGKVYFDKECTLLASSLKTTVGKGRDSKRVEIPLGIKTVEKPIVKLRLRAEAVTGQLKFVLTDLKVVTE